MALRDVSIDQSRIQCHPLHLLKPEEVSEASSILLSYLRKQDLQDRIHFKNVSIHDPPKALLLPHLNAEAAGVPFNQRPYVPRCVDITWSTAGGRQVTESVVSLDTKTVVAESHIRRGQQGPNDKFEMKPVAEAILNHPKVHEAVKALRLPDEFVVACDPWMFGADRDLHENDPKLCQALLYARAKDQPDSNQYAYPLPISVRYNVWADELVQIDTLATGGRQDGLAYHTASEYPMAHLLPNDYYPGLFPEGERTDLKPLIVSQPEGPSFKVTDENSIHWQKWKFRVGFNHREGLTIHDVRYDGRPVFYRLSVSDMTVPYGDPRSPYHRKQAFDLGDLGAGACANNLAVGCDCLGAIRYFNGCLSDNEGNPLLVENVICVHEQDGGIGWKHTNHRTQNPAVTRARNLVVQIVITVSNYEYIFAWIFMQNGNVELETRATGIVSTALIDPGKTSDWGTVVSPGVLAQNHQHLFCMRIDPMIDGQHNTVMQEDSVSIPQSDDENPYGTAWRVVKTPLERSGFADAAPFANRCFKIVNENHINPISQTPVGYKLTPQPCQLLLADKASVARNRARFAEHHVWVTKYRDGDLWAGGKWTNQSLRETDGVFDYAARNEHIRGQDVVVWHTYGMTHNPRVEDFPVMPSEIITIKLMPSDFFLKNPALDVPQSRQRDNKSVLVHDAMPTETYDKDFSGKEDGCSSCVKAKL